MNNTDDLATRNLKKRAAKIGFVLLIVVLVLAGAVFTALIRNGVSLYAISGDSMEPTFSHKDSVVLQQAKSVEKDHIIFFEQPKSWNTYVSVDHLLVKRIVAVPGDVLEYDGNVFTVNGDEVFNVSESEYECSMGDDEYSHTLTNKEIFVMGDNYTNSLDSRRVFCDGDAEDMYVPVRSVSNYGEVVFKF